MNNDTRKNEGIQTEDFWRTTWERWRAGALADISPAYQKAAEVSFEKFLKHSPEVVSSPMGLFMRESSPQTGEFLIGYGEYGLLKKTSFVLTNMRLLIRNHPENRYDIIPLSQVETAQVRIGWSATVRIVKHGGEELIFPKLHSPPNEVILQRAIAQAGANPAWDVRAGQGTAAAAKPSPPGSMFAESDYLPFMLGIFVVGGFIGIPIVYGIATGLGYFESLPWSLLSCLVFLFAFRRNGTISWGRAIPAIVASMIAINAYNQNTGKPVFVAGGFIGFLLVMVCGYIGLGVGRLFKRKGE
jgi:hypothetical protein